MANMASNSPALLPLNPPVLSPNKMMESPKFCQFDVVVKPASANKMIPVHKSPATKVPVEVRLSSAERRRLGRSEEKRQSLEMKFEKIQRAQRKINLAFEEEQKEKLQKVIQKEEVVASNLLLKRQEEEQKREERRRREKEAREKERLLSEEKRRVAEEKLQALKIMEENRKEVVHHVIEKAASELQRVEDVRRNKQQEQKLLEEKVKMTLYEAELRKNQLLCERQETAAAHVEHCKKVAAMTKAERGELKG